MKNIIRQTAIIGGLLFNFTIFGCASTARDIVHDAPQLEEKAVDSVQSEGKNTEDASEVEEYDAHNGNAVKYSELEELLQDLRRRTQ